MFENYDIVHLNHCNTQDGLPQTPIGQIGTLDSSFLYPAYFPDSDLLQCKEIAGCYGAGISAELGPWQSAINKFTETCLARFPDESS